MEYLDENSAGLPAWLQGIRLFGFVRGAGCILLSPVLDAHKCFERTAGSGSMAAHFLMIFKMNQ
jgi:hypothetical protein